MCKRFVLIYYNCARSKSIMLLEILISVLLLALVLIYLLFIYPNKQKQFYKRQFEAAGFKPYMMPYNCAKITYSETLEIGRRHGDPFKMYKENFQGYDLVIGNIFNEVSISLFNPELIKEFCENERTWNYMKDRDINLFLQRVVGRGLLTSDGSMWKKKRKALNQVFNYDFISSQTGTIIECCLQAFQQVIGDRSKELKGVFSMKELAISFTSKFIFEGFLGGDLKKQKIHGESPAKIIKDLMDHIVDEADNDAISMVLGPKFTKMGIRRKDKQFNRKMQAFNDWAHGYIQTRVDQQNEKIKRLGELYVATDIISSLLLLNSKSQDGKEYQEEDLVSELKTFFMAGIETTSSFFMSLVYYVFSDPEIQAKLREELSLKMIKDKIRFSDIKNMPYLEAVQSQVLRIHGPANGITPRRATCDHFLKGAKIKKGLYIEYFSLVNQFSQVYFPEPLKCRPERWINNQSIKLHPYTVMPFHSGPRACIGKHVALLSSKIAILMFLQKFSKVQVKTKKIETEVTFVYCPKQFHVQVTFWP